MWQPHSTHAHSMTSNTPTDVYHPHWLVQWGHHCSRMCIPVHSPWLPGYIDVAQTILVILTMDGLFLDRRMCTCVCVYGERENIDHRGSLFLWTWHFSCPRAVCQIFWDGVTFNSNNFHLLWCSLRFCIKVVVLFFFPSQNLQAP